MDYKNGPWSTTGGRFCTRSLTARCNASQLPTSDFQLPPTS
ncbi:hypothetical protein [Nostoc sp. LPT]|nr:hypothetical protein [Nostoc sp. LPT]